VNSTPAKRLNSAGLDFPSQLLDDYAEGFVQIRYTVGTDGAVRDVNILRLIGPARFAENVVTRAHAWKFQPATLNGKPVEQSLMFVGVYKNPRAGTHGDVVETYSKAADLLKQNKIDEAQSLLNGTLSRPELTFYERGMLSLLLASILEQKKDFLAVHELAVLSTDAFGGELPANALQALFKLRVGAALSIGDMGDAMLASLRLERVKGFDPKDPIVDSVEKALLQLNQAAVVAVEARIPEAGKGDEYSLHLFRRDIGFRNVTGLGKFTISCNQGVVESEVSENAEWHIPHDWNVCFIFVHGAPGANFQVLEFSPEIAQTPAKQ
jgi:TonB family protein